MSTTVTIREDGKQVEKQLLLSGRKLHLLRCKRSAKDIMLTEEASDTTGWYEILDVSKECKHFSEKNVGDFVWLPAMSVGRSYRVGVAERIVQEKWFDEYGGPPLMVIKGESA